MFVRGFMDTYRTLRWKISKLILTEETALAVKWSILNLVNWLFHKYLTLLVMLGA
jgi:hypothetical protein